MKSYNYHLPVNKAFYLQKLVKRFNYRFIRAWYDPDNKEFYYDLDYENNLDNARKFSVMETIINQAYF